MTIVAVTKVPVDSNFIIGVFNRQFKVSATVGAADNFGDDIVWFYAGAELDGIQTFCFLYVIFPISLVEDVDVVAFAASERIFALTADEGVVAGVAVESVVAGVTIYQSVQITRTERFSVGRTA